MLVLRRAEEDPPTGVPADPGPAVLVTLVLSEQLHAGIGPRSVQDMLVLISGHQ